MPHIPPVSVTVPALNEALLIERLLESFSKQTNSDFEVIIVDNGSTDDTQAIVRAEIARNRFLLTLLCEEQKGVGFARRKGMDDATDRSIPYLAGTDADSVVPPCWIHDIIHTFEKTKADCLFGLSSPDWSVFKKYPDLYTLFRDTWVIRQAVTKHIRIPARGVNFAITAEMYRRVGGMPQPQDGSGNPLAGEDIELQNRIEAHGGTIALLDSEVVTSPRRVLQAMLLDSPHDYYKDIGDVRDEEALVGAVHAYDRRRIEHFVDETIQRFFTTYIIKNVDTDLWDTAKQFIAPNERSFLDDVLKMDSEDLYKKYREVFIRNAHAYA